MKRIATTLALAVSIAWASVALLTGTSRVPMPQNGRQSVNSGSSDTISKKALDFVTNRFDAVVGMPADTPTVYLVFSADSLCEGLPFIEKALHFTHTKASFFFTGNFLRDPAHAPIIKQIISRGHYVGGHSDRHIQLADWSEERVSLVTPDSLRNDINANYEELERFGITRSDAHFFMPPFEWCNSEHSAVIRDMGFVPVVPSPALLTYRDYTTPDMADYHTSAEMLSQLLDYEKEHGLNGAVILIHPGTQDVRTDKFYHKLYIIIDTLRKRGYTFSRL